MSVETEATRWLSIHPSSNSGKASAKETNDSGNNKHRRTNQCEERDEAQIDTAEQAATPTIDTQLRELWQLECPKRSLKEGDDIRGCQQRSEKHRQDFHP